MSRAILISAWIAANLVSACTTAGPAGEHAARVTEATAGGEPAAKTIEPIQMSSSTVTIPGALGLELIGTFTGASEGRSPAVLLLHMYGSDRRSWQPLTEDLSAAGIASLAIDLRGQGETGGSEDWELAGQDVASAFTWLQDQPGIDASRVGVVGASIGANLALVQTASHPDEVAAAVLLSPGLDYFRVKIEGRAKETDGVPLFLAASEQDGYSADTVRLLADETPGEPTVALFDGASHGTDMFATHPQLVASLVQFLKENLSR